MGNVTKQRESVSLLTSEQHLQCAALELSSLMQAVFLLKKEKPRWFVQIILCLVVAIVMLPCQRFFTLIRFSVERHKLFAILGLNKALCASKLPKCLVAKFVPLDLKIVLVIASSLRLWLLQKPSSSTALPITCAPLEVL